MKQEINSLSELEAFASKLSKELKPGAFVILTGELGAGKTTLVQLFAKAFNSNAPTSSPTYVLENRYQTPSFIIRHWDLYRVSSVPEEIFEEMKNSITFIEWGEKFPEILSAATLSIKIETCKIPSKRIITLN